MTLIGTGLCMAIDGEPGPSMTEDGGTVRLPISSLNPAESPRLRGEDADHVRALAEIVSSLPPIIVHRPTMRVVDGMHRIRAALQRGQTTIAARLFDGTEGEAFVLAVRENIGHGLPLSLTDRKAAAARIIADYPEWSDRSVATIVGLAPSSVGAIRKRSTDRVGQLNRRIGKDGRVRPVNAAKGQQRVSELIAAHPGASLRQIAREAEVSVGTAHAVRKRMAQSGDRQLALAGESDRDGPVRSAPGRRVRAHGTELLDWSSLRQRLWEDPTLRYTESGRRLLQWLDAHAISQDEWVGIVESLPPHWSTAVASVADRIAAEWRDFAEKVRRNGEEPGKTLPAS